MTNDVERKPKLQREARERKGRALDLIQAAIVLSGGRMVSRNELLEMTVEELLDRTAPNNVCIKAMYYPQSKEFD